MGNRREQVSRILPTSPGFHGWSNARGYHRLPSKKKNIGIMAMHHYTYVQFRGMRDTSIHPSFLSHVKILHDFSKEIHHVGFQSNLESIKRGSLIPGGHERTRRRHATDFTLANPLQKHDKVDTREGPPHIMSYHFLKPSHDAIYVLDLLSAQHKFVQTFNWCDVCHEKAKLAACIWRIIATNRPLVWAKLPAAAPPPRPMFVSNF